MKLFFQDPVQQTPWSHQELERIGRQVLAKFLDPNDPNDATARARLNALQDDGIWAAMDSTGNVNAFGSIGGLQKLSPNELSDVSVDWTDITWWADAMTNVAPKLGAVLSALKNSTANDPTTDPSFMKKRAGLRLLSGKSRGILGPRSPAVGESR